MLKNDWSSAILHNDMAKKGDIAFLTPLSTIFQLYRGGQFQKKKDLIVIFHQNLQNRYKSAVIKNSLKNEVIYVKLLIAM